VLDTLQRKYDLPICPECFPTLYNCYRKMEFIKIGDDVYGYIEMARFSNIF